MFRRRFLRTCRAELKADLPDIGIIPDDQWATAVANARLKAEASLDEFALPVGALTSSGPTAIFDGHLIAQFREWLKTPGGQFFLQVLKAIAAALIAALLAGS